jgi:hypothetical protein
VLVDHADPVGHRLTGAPDGYGVAADLDGAFVGLVEAVQDVDQRGLPGAVLAEQSVDLASSNLQVDASIGDHAREPLGDPDHPKERLHRAPIATRALAEHATCLPNHSSMERPPGRCDYAPSCGSRMS